MRRWRNCGCVHFWYSSFFIPLKYNLWKWKWNSSFRFYWYCKILKAGCWAVWTTWDKMQNVSRHRLLLFRLGQVSFLSVNYLLPHSSYYFVTISICTLIDFLRENHYTLPLISLFLIYKNHRFFWVSTFYFFRMSVCRPDALDMQNNKVYIFYLHSNWKCPKFVHIPEIKPLVGFD